MNSADPVVKTGAAQAQAGHVETVSAVPGPQGEDLIEIQARLFKIRAKVVGKKFPGKNVMACRDWRMGGKQCCTGDGLQCSFKG